MARTPAFPEAIPLGPLSALLRRSLLARQGSALDRGCVKTSARFHTGLFRSLLRGLRAFRVEKITNNLALLDRLKNFGEFLHGLDPERSLVGQKSRIPRRDFETEKSGLLLDICNGERLVCLVFNKTNISRFMRKLYGAPLEFHFWLVSGPAAANGRQFRNPILAENPTNAAGWEKSSFQDRLRTWKNVRCRRHIRKATSQLIAEQFRNGVGAFLKRPVRGLTVAKPTLERLASEDDLFVPRSKPGEHQIGVIIRALLARWFPR